MKLAIASISLLLAACSASQAPADGVPQPAESSAPVASETPAAKRAPGEDDVESLQVFRAFGTEPFWNVAVQGEQLTFTTPEDQEGMVMQGTRAGTADAGSDITGNMDGTSFSLSVRPGTCSDGMSDNVYEMTSTFSLGDTRYNGCAEAAK